MDRQEKLKVVFAPGCFDSFTGTQEELDELIAEINHMVESGELFESASLVDVESMDPETLEQLENALEFLENDEPRNRRLN